MTALDRTKADVIFDYIVKDMTKTNPESQNIEAVPNQEHTERGLQT